MVNIQEFSIRFRRGSLIRLLVTAQRGTKLPCLRVGSNITIHPLSTHLLSSFRVINHISQKLYQRELSSYHYVLIPLLIYPSLYSSTQHLKCTSPFLAKVSCTAYYGSTCFVHSLCSFFRADAAHTDKFDCMQPSISSTAQEVSKSMNVSKG